ncbi:WD40-repeat-containing domain, partial [Trinorchestia longiramus]
MYFRSTSKAVCTNCFRPTSKAVCLHVQVYDAGDFSQLAECGARDGETTYSGGSFVSNETILVWGESGRGYIYKLPNNCVVGTKEFHRKQADDASPILIGVCKAPSANPQVTPPAWQYQMIPVQSGAEKLLVRGDSEGSVVLWRIKDLQQQELVKLLSVKPVQPATTKITVHTSLQQEWAKLDPPPVGLLDHVAPMEGLCGGRSGGGGAEGNRVCATLFLGTQGRVACGREDGSILLLPATEAIMLHLLHTEQPQHSVSQSMILRGHERRVTCLLYPHGESGGGVGGGGGSIGGGGSSAGSPPAPRYPANQLVSGGADFAVIIWDLTTGAQLQRFVVQAGPVLQLMITPSTCSVRVQQCVVSVAGDHSVALLSLKEARVVLLAAHHPCPVTALKWRPLHDFMVVATQDGSVHVWQMETVQLLADEYAAMTPGSLEAAELTLTSRYQRINILTHPASPEAAKKIAEFFGKVKDKAGEMEKKMKDKDKHDLIGRALDKAAAAHGTTAPAPPDGGDRTDGASSGLMWRVRESAGTVQTFLQTRTDHTRPQTLHATIDLTLAGPYTATSKTLHHDRGEISVSQSGPYRLPGGVEEMQEGGRRVRLEWGHGTQAVEVPNQTLQIGQLVLSVLHSWGLDPALDATCLSLLGLLRPRVPPAFGLLTKAGFMSLFLPTWHPVKDSGGPPTAPHPSLAQHLPPELIKLQHATQVFSSRGHWEISSALSTQHLVAVVALANTLQHRNAATLHPFRERNRRIHLLNAHNSSVSPEQDAAFRQEQSKIKQGWSTLTALHSVLLPDAVAKAGASAYQPPLLEVLARRWHSRCQEIRDAAQVLLQTELVRIGRVGRQAVLDEWAPHLPSLPDSLPGGAHNTGTTTAAQKSTNNQPLNGTTTNSSSNSAVVNGNSNNNTQNGSNSHSSGSDKQQQQQQQQHETTHSVEDYHFDEDHLEGLSSSSGGVDGGQQGGHGRSSHQGVAIVLLAVIGAYHGHHQDEGFMLGSPLAVKTSKALAHLLLSPPTPRLPLHTPLRRAAIDLIGRGFSVWEPYLDVAK